MSDRIVLNEDYHADTDIRIYLQLKFHETTLSHPARAHLPTPWPSVADIDWLVEKSFGQVIYAPTVIKFIKSHHHSPEERLDIVFELAATPDQESPFAELDSFYRQMFSAVATVNDTLEVFSILFLADAEYVENSPRAIE